MLFLERKKKTGYQYDVEDIFGKIHLESSTQLPADILDEIVGLLLRQNISAGKVEGEVKHGEGIITYEFTKEPIWSDDDEEEPCENTPTSTSKQERGSNPILRWIRKTTNWLRRFVEAFREAYKKTK
jgi:hypothetical protein